MSESTTSSKTSINADDEMSSPEVIIVDGSAKFRDGKRWKQRFCVLTKLSPVADCLQLQVYRDEKERARNGHTKASLSLQDFLALESGFTLDKESHTLAILCQELNVVLAFDNRERLIQWSVRIANNLGEGQHFLVQLASAPSKSKLSPGPVKLHVIDNKFCLTGAIPPRLLGFWEIPHLRRYGIVENRIIFEGGSRCGKGEGVHVLIPDPPQLHLIIDALDSSSKGQLARAPSSRRFQNVTDSPRKSMTSRLSEMRGLSSIPAESSANVSMMNMNMSMSNSTSSSTPGSNCMTNLSISSTTSPHCTISPTPRESKSAEALCTGCGEIPSATCQNSNPNSAWISSESSSSRCDLDVDNCDAICPAEESSSRVKIGPHSPARVIGQMQIAKPLPSAMERCLSCMSKLGQQGQNDILSPSWTMDLNVPSNSGSSGHQHALGSIGSGNSDRLSISSHGSSGEPTTAYYYDTPRSVLAARANARANTPPGIFQNGNQNTNTQMVNSSGCHNGSPCRTQQQQQQQQRISHGSLGTSSSCPQGGCPCPQQRTGGGHPAPTNSSASAHIYYGIVESKSGSTKPPINLHAGPYENYDFPRTVAPVPANPALAWNSYGTSQDLSCSQSIDWNKKLPMDRSSVATTASTSISMVSSDPLDFYDTPRAAHCPCCAPSNSNTTSNTSGCPCCSTVSSAMSSHHHHQQQQQHSHYQNPSCILRSRADPLENYDVPPMHNPLNNKSNAPASASISINGEGKMPLVAGSIPVSNNPHAIYAQVDKSKKTPRVPQQFITCDNIYENRNAQLMHQPTYMNLDGNPQAQALQLGKTGKAPLPSPTKTMSHVQPHHHHHHLNEHGGRIVHPQDAHSHSNYVNMQFAESLQLYENSFEIANSSNSNNETQVLVHPEPRCQVVDPGDKKEEEENAYENTPSVPVPVIPESSTSNIKDTKEVPAPSTITTEEEKVKSSAPVSAPVMDDAVKSGPSSGSVSLEDSRRGSQESTSDEAVSLPLRRSSSVPCKGGHANRGSASSSDSGVSGDGALFFDDSSPSNDIGSLCLHESLPRKSQRNSPSGTGKNTLTTSTPRPQESVEEVAGGADVDPTLANRHYESIDEVESSSGSGTRMLKGNNSIGNSSISTSTLSQPINPLVAAAKCAESGQSHSHRGRSVNVNGGNLVSSESTSSGNSDMSDYIDTLSTCSSSRERDSFGIGNQQLPTLNVNLNISSSPKKSTSMKPRSGKEYFKIDRSVFKAE